MGASGTTLVDFGSTYTNDTSVAVAGQGSILGSSVAEAWLFPATTVDHSVDEHVIAATQLAITAGPPTAGVGFTIYATCLVPGGLYGKWNVGWVWN